MIKNIGKILVVLQKNNLKAGKMAVVRNGFITGSNYNCYVRIKTELETGVYNPELLKKDIIIKENKDIEDFKNFNFTAEGKKIEVNFKELQNSLKDFDFIKPCRDNLSIDGMRFFASDGVLTLVKTDTYRILKKSIFIDSRENFEFTVNTDTINILKDIKTKEEKIKITISNNALLFEVAEYTIKQEINTMPYPDWRGIHKNLNFTKKVEFKRFELVELLKKHIEVSKNNPDSKNSSLFVFNDLEKFKIISKNEEVEIEDNLLTLNSFEETFKINLNSKFILEYLKIIKGDIITLKMNNKSMACMIDNYLFMPLALREDE